MKDKQISLFQSARLKLTAWYLLIIMLISILFSVALYIGINREFARIQRFRQLRRERLERQLRTLPFTPPLPPEYDVSEARDRLILTLTLINLGILVLAGGAGYFLAGRTLRPIKIMLDEQNRFITDASHELKTPLTALRSAIEVYLLGKHHALTKADAILSSNLEEVISLQGLSENLIKLTKYQQTSGNALIFAEISLLDVIEDALKRVIPLARQKHITINNQMTDETTTADRQSLGELLIILLDNAIKYSPENTTVTITSAAIDHSVMIRITDQGIGIADQDLPHIFDRFYRADKSRSTAEAGYGLGLSIAKQIVTTHHGTITVQSQLHKGTTFTVKLPHTCG